MKANELMIGDWVYYEHSSPKAWEPRKWQIVAFEKGFIELADPDTSCKPIPLTGEILEKNGFSHFHEQHGSVEIWKISQESFHMKRYLFKNKDENIIYFHDRTFPIIYVHELQHALRLCRLTELADNFRIN